MFVSGSLVWSDLTIRLSYFIWDFPRFNLCHSSHLFVCDFLICDDLPGGYVAADITALVAEAMLSITCSSEDPYHHRDYHSFDARHDNEDSSSESNRGNSHGPISDSDSGVAPSPAVSFLLDTFTQAMCAVPPSCLRGLALQLPNVRCAILSCSLLLESHASRYSFKSSEPSLLSFAYSPKRLNLLCCYH